jgi:hypothetical protein
MPGLRLWHDKMRCWHMCSTAVSSSMRTGNSQSHFEVGLQHCCRADEHETATIRQPLMSCRLRVCITGLLRGKLSQLEHNVLAGAAASTPGGAAAGNVAAAGSATPKQGGGTVDLRALLQSLGLGEEVMKGLTEVGVGPSGPQDGDGDPQQQQQQGWATANGGLDQSANWSSRWVQPTIVHSCDVALADCMM